MKRANSGLTCIRQKNLTAFFRNLAVAPKITHETFDELPADFDGSGCHTAAVVDGAANGGATKAPGSY
ncbi:hypothetical protein [Arthrobacter sp. UYCu712]|uniref:hypothetical protein n=1 Tax=Arthrobacter sp. UYCu712 TaxID=3156340 RepID=UPI003399A1B4